MARAPGDATVGVREMTDVPRWRSAAALWALAGMLGCAGNDPPVDTRRSGSDAGPGSSLDAGREVDGGVRAVDASGGAVDAGMRAVDAGAGAADAGMRAVDAGARCGDGVCSASETCASCASDCGACPPMCGDGACNGSETCASCASDCGACPPPCGELGPGDGIATGESVTSCDGRFTLVMQGDGNLVLYQGATALWSTDTYGTAGDRAIMQTDGNFVLYAGGTALWASDTYGNPGAHLAVQDDGNTVVYASGGTALWSTGTCCR